MVERSRRDEFEGAKGRKFAFGEVRLRQNDGIVTANAINGEFVCGPGGNPGTPLLAGRNFLFHARRTGSFSLPAFGE